MSTERMTVSLDDFLKYLLKKWKMIMIFVGVGMILFSVATMIFGEQLEVPPSEEYLYLKEQEESFEDYIERSILMQMDPTNIYEKTLFISNISEKEALKDFVEAGTVWGEISQQISEKYLTELTSWEENGENVEVKVRHSEGTQCDEFAEYIAEQLQEYDEGINVNIGTQHIVADKSVAKTQVWYQNRLQDIKGQLEYTAAGYTIEASITAAVILGMLTGGLAAVVILFFGFLLNGKLRSVDEIEYYTKAKIIGKKKGIKEKEQVPELETAAFEELLKAGLEANEKMILINLTKELIGIDGLEEIQGVDFVEMADERERVLSSNSIILGVAANETIYKEMDRVLKILAENEKEIYGCIAC